MKPKWACRMVQYRPNNTKTKSVAQLRAEIQRVLWNIFVSILRGMRQHSVSRNETAQRIEKWDSTAYQEMRQHSVSRNETAQRIEKWDSTAYQEMRQHSVSRNETAQRIEEWDSTACRGMRQHSVNPIDATWQQQKNFSQCIKRQVVPIWHKGH